MTLYEKSKRERHLFLKVTLLLVVAIVLFVAMNVNPTRRIEASEAEPRCNDGAIGNCVINGKRGKRDCISGNWGPCIPNPTPTPTPSVTGLVRPKYYVLSVLYAPPGTQGGRSSSSVTYGSGSTTGTTVSSTASFKENYLVGLKTGVGLLGQGGSVGTTFEYGRNSSNSTSLDIKKTAATQISYTGPTSDGINHDYDIIYLWLNPVVEVSLTPASSPTSASWKLKDNSTADIQYVYVRWLKNPSEIPAGLLQRFETYGITSEDYQEMLKADPFADGSTRINPDRYEMVNTTFPYEPPVAEGDPVPTLSFVLTHANNATSTASTQEDYKVGATVEGSVPFVNGIEIGIKTAATWNWTVTDTRVSTEGTSESASVTVGGPAFGYTGPTDIGVYYDRLYKTFLFVPVETSLFSLRGSVMRRAGRAMALKEVVVVAKGVKYRTFTNARGEYRLYGNISGPIRLQVGGVRKTLSKLPANRVTNLVGR